MRPYPYSAYCDHAVLERTNSGWRVDHIQIVYDWEAAAAQAIRSGREDWAFRLRMGRAR